MPAHRHFLCLIVSHPHSCSNLSRSGFNSAVEAAQNAIRSAKTEAVCNLPNGIGIVKLMGRSAGFIAAHATMASSDVDLCLVPEVPIVLEGEKGCLPYLMRRVRQQGFAVIVVAEGAGEDVLGSSAETDASGNKKLPAIGEFLKKTISEYFAKQGEVATVKYIDPSYMVRSVPANAADSLYCMQLAQNAVRKFLRPPQASHTPTSSSPSPSLP
jgi:6-phosphofructokinase 1